MRKICLATVCLGLLGAIPITSLGQESPYFVTYDHHLEEPGNLEIATSATIGVPRSGQHAFFAPYTELEYGVLGRWTTELYLEGQSTAHDSSIFTGWRLENRVRPFLREHWINPVLYLEFEDISEADKIQKEIVGHAPDLSSQNGLLRAAKDRELESKLILSSNTHDWNISENLIIEKNFSANEGIEFGYAVGVSRPLASLASSMECRWCRENFSTGIEFYGGLGSTQQFGLSETAQYAAPVIAWQVSDNASLRLSPSFGLTHESAPVLFRVGYIYEVQGFGRKLAQWFGSKP
jgi:hypothetical protein